VKGWGVRGEAKTYISTLYIFIHCRVNAWARLSLQWIECNSCIWQISRMSQISRILQISRISHFAKHLAFRISHFANFSHFAFRKYLAFRKYFAFRISRNVSHFAFRKYLANAHTVRVTDYINSCKSSSVTHNTPKRPPCQFGRESVDLLVDKCMGVSLHISREYR